MRIITGKYKGMPIILPRDMKMRPTTDFAKEGLFNVLNNMICFEEAELLDLFAGTGGITYEFISRSCVSSVSVEINSRQCAFISQMCKKLEAPKSFVVKADVFKYLEGCKRSFSLIFADPPYDNEKINEIPDLIFKNSLLKKGALFILEHSEKYSFGNNPHFSELRKYGKVHFSFFENNENEKK